jgi:hypothetical protein
MIYYVNKDGSNIYPYDTIDTGSNSLENLLTSISLQNGDIVKIKKCSTEYNETDIQELPENIRFESYDNNKPHIIINLIDDEYLLSTCNQLYNLEITLNYNYS